MDDPKDDARETSETSEAAPAADEPEAEAEDAPPASDESSGAVGSDGEHVEAVGSGKGATGAWVYECSAGDYHSRVEADVDAHIASVHGGKAAKPKAAAKPRTQRAKGK